MNEPRFFQTLMGRRFYEDTMPRIARSLEEISKRMTQARAFESGDEVLVDGVGFRGDYRVTRSGDAGLCLCDDNGHGITIVIKRQSKETP